MKQLAIVVSVLAASWTTAASPTVTIRADRRHQTILGWGGMPWYPNVTADVRDQVLDEAVGDLGLTRLHWTVPSGNRSEGRSWEWTNDDADPLHVHWPGFATGVVDRSVGTWVLPFKQRVEAQGERLGLAITQTFHNGGSTGSVPVWLLGSPAEFAEYATSLLLYLKNTHRLQADYYVICKDAGDSADNPFEVPVVAKLTKAFGTRLRALGLSTKVLFPECHDANPCWKFIHAVRDDKELWSSVGMVGYHLYGGEARNTDRPNIRDFALAKGLPIGHAGSDGINLDTLYDDLALGDVSYWSIVGLGGPQTGGAFYIHLDNASFSRGGQYWQYRQVMHYVRPGAVRIEAVSDTPAIRALAFVHKDRTTVVLINNTPPLQPRTVKLQNLPPGDYGVCRCVGSRPYEELGIKHVGDDGALTVDLPADCVLTVYPHPTKNLPPTVVEWKAEPNFLKTPASRVRLWAAAQDPELDRLSYSWSVTKQPLGANAVLVDPRSATTEASRLTVPGRYTFTVTVSDGVNEVRREVLLNVYAGNQPPMLIDVHNRLPVLVTLPQSQTELRGGALDLEGDKLTYRWSVVSQPAGSAVVLETPQEGKCRLSDISKAGDHVFKFEASDGTSMVSEKLTVTVYPANSAPVIDAITAVPVVLTLPESTAFLSASTSDPDGDVISHWWRVKRSPAGAKVVLAKPGGRDTKVSGLTVAGTYVFELTVVDRTKFATKEVVIVVQARRDGAR